MRLLHIHTFAFREFHGDDIPPYVIASHRWSDQEAKHKDVKKRRNTESKGYKKVEGFCAYAAREDHLVRMQDPNWPAVQWLWIDTCCINQDSSAEISEAVNSMYSWYSHAQECLVYLADVCSLSQGWDAVLHDFRNSEWFTRGWTLQELLAPHCVIFLTQDWQVFGHKCGSCDEGAPCIGAGRRLNGIIADITAIPERVLFASVEMSTVSVEERAGWAAERKTTRVEDMAYCMLGLFDVNMPLLYGEGQRAVRRLEKEIRKKIDYAVEKGFGEESSANATAIVADNFKNSKLQSYIGSGRTGRQFDHLPAGRDSATLSNRPPIILTDYPLSALLKLPTHIPLRTRRRVRAYSDYRCDRDQCAAAGVALTSKEDLDHHILVSHDARYRLDLSCPFAHCFRRDEHAYHSELDLIRHIEVVHRVNRANQKSDDLELGLG